MFDDVHFAQTCRDPRTSCEPRRRRLVITGLTLVGALAALTLPASWLGHRSGAATSAAMHSGSYSVAAPNTLRPISKDRSVKPTFFGFLEFDWDPDAPGGVPGFDPWPRP